MKRATALATAGLLLSLCVLAVTGCETGRVNKLHSSYETASDVTTTPHPEKQFASVNTGNPPVPGSPTAAGPDGRQPANDNQARVSPGSDQGISMAPRKQPVDKFVGQ